jgi:hypothetical protein
MAVAIKDAASRRLLPPLRDGSVFSVLFIGCKDFVEGNVDYDKLYTRLLSLEIYPPSSPYYLEVTLIGPELTSRPPFHFPSGRVTVNRLCGRLQRLFPENATPNARAEFYAHVGEFSHVAHKINVSHYMSFNEHNGAPALASKHALSSHYACAILRNPGLSSTAIAPSSLPSSPANPAASKHVTGGVSTSGSDASLRDQWRPAVKMLLDAGLLTIVLNACADSTKRSTPTTSSSGAGVLPAIHTNGGQGGVGSAHSSPVHWGRKEGSPHSSAKVFGSAVYTPLEDKRADQARAVISPAVVADELALSDDYSAAVVIPHTCLPCTHCADASSGNSTTESPASVSGKREQSYPESCMYLAFQGRRSAVTNAHIAFYTYMAKNNAALSEACWRVVTSIGTGRVHFPAEWTQTELEHEAIRWNIAANPLQAQLLQHELLAQLREQEHAAVMHSGGGGAGSGAGSPQSSVAPSPEMPHTGGAGSGGSPAGAWNCAIALIGNTSARSATSPSAPGTGAVGKQVHFEASHTSVMPDAKPGPGMSASAKTGDGTGSAAVVMTVPLPTMVFKRK